jgi:hypothetical protein
MAQNLDDTVVKFCVARLSTNINYYAHRNKTLHCVQILEYLKESKPKYYPYLSRVAQSV